MVNMKESLEISNEKLSPKHSKMLNMAIVKFPWLGVGREKGQGAF